MPLAIAAAQTPLMLAVFAGVPALATAIQMLSPTCSSICRSNKKRPAGNPAGPSAARRAPNAESNAERRTPAYFTFHSCSPTDQFGCIVTSSRSAFVFTGLNVSLFHAFFATPNASVVSTGFHSSPSL